MGLSALARHAGAGAARVYPTSRFSVAPLGAAAFFSGYSELNYIYLVSQLFPIPMQVPMSCDVLVCPVSSLSST